jgi:molybdate transport system substrate-binding protein
MNARSSPSLQQVASIPIRKTVVRRICRRTALLALAVPCLWPLDALAEKVKVLSASALKVIVTELAEQFRTESGHTLELAFATAGEVEKRVLGGEAVDVAIATDAQMARIAEKALVVEPTRAVIARVGVGIAVREGAAKPDIANAEALRRTLLAVNSVTYPDPAKGGASGIHFAGVIEKLGIAEAVKAKSVLGANPDFVCVAVAKGEVEMCVHQISEIIPVKGVTLVGPLPKEVQRATTFAVAASAKAAAPKAAEAFARFLASVQLAALRIWLRFNESVT